MSKTMKISSICRGCLASDRTLTSVENHYNVYHNIIKKSMKMEIPILETPLMCWECKSSLRNFEKFFKKVLEAHNFLSETREEYEIKTLSTLSISTNQSIIDIKYNSDNTKFDSILSDDNECNVKINIEVKDEPTDYKPNDIDYDNYNESIDFHELFDDKELIVDELKKEPLENIVEQEHSSIKKEKNRGIKFKKKKDRKNYRVIYMNGNINIKMYERVKIDEKERAYWMEREKLNRNYRSMAYKCESCISGFAKEKYYVKHVKTFHTQFYGEFVCDVCKIRLRKKSKLHRHIKEHYTKYKCNVCDYESYNSHQMDTHLFCAHKRAVECLKCGLRFTQVPHFYNHYKNLHRKFTCDYCGQSFIKKNRLIKHIGKNHQMHRCEVCNKVYKTFDSLFRHNSLHHVKSARELCYCVECNIQFDNVSLYNRHIKMSVKHRQNSSIPCPECDKVYNRRCSMINHYNHVHLKKTKHYCAPCDKFFLNGFRLRQHTASTHDKVPQVKNKICPYCARGFSTNRILDNHIRTHTGERPFACECCSASFTQRQALVSHSRAIHKILDFK